MSSILKSPTRRQVLIVDNHPLARRGLTGLIDSERDLRVCAAAATYQAAVAAIVADRPDLVITDLSLEVNDDGLKLLEFIQATYSDLPVLVLTAHALPRFAERALKAGASGYITKQAMTDTLLIAIRRVLDGELYVPANIKTQLNIH